LFVALDKDFEAGINQLFGSGRSKSGATLKLLLFTAKPEEWFGHYVWEEGSIKESVNFFFLFY
jgi:hypothetical protein